MTRERWLHVALLLLCGVLFFYGLGSRPLWDQDEGMHATTSRDMVESGDWITPHFNGEPFYDKPILFTWASALAFVLLGFSEFAARLPAALFGTGCVWLTYLLGRRMAGPLAGLLSAAVLATSGEFIVLSRVVVHDIALAFACTLALYAFWVAFDEGDGTAPDAPAVHRGRWLALFYAACGLAVLAKGPVGLLPPFVVAVFLVGARRLNFVRELRLVRGALIVIVVAGPWYVAMALANEDFVSYFLDEKVFGSLADSDHAKARPLHYYLPVLAGGLYPWSLFVPSALWYALRVRAAGDTRAANVVLFLVSWALPTLVVFSLASAKLSTYILPLFPAFALLVGRAAADLWTEPTRALHRAFLVPASLLLALPVALFLVLWIQPPPLIDEFHVGHGRALFTAAVLTLGFGIAWVGMLRRAYGLFFGAAFSTMAATLLVFVHLLAPNIEPYRSTRSVGWRMDALLQSGEPLAFYRRIVGVGDSVLFYTGRRAVRLAHPAMLKEHLDADDPAFVVISQKYFDRIGDQLEGRYVVYREGNKLILSNRASDDPRVQGALHAVASGPPGQARTGSPQ